MTRAERIFRQRKSSVGFTVVDPGHYTLSSCGLWTLIMCHGRLSVDHRCTAVETDVDTRGACVGAGQGMYRNSILHARFCREPDIALKKLSSLV